MAGSLIENRDELFQLVTDAWNDAPSVTGLPGPFYALLYGTLDTDGVPPEDPGNLPWARASVRSDDARSTSISERRYTVSGMVSVQVFASSYRSNAKTVTQRIAEAITLALMDHEGNVTIQNPRTIDRMGDNGFERTDAVADFIWYGFRQRGHAAGTLPPEGGGGGGDGGNPQPPPTGESYTFTQSTPEVVWTVNHNLGYRPSVEVLDTGGREMLAAVQHMSFNQFRVFHDTPTAGSVIYR